MDNENNIKDVIIKETEAERAELASDTELTETASLNDIEPTDLASKTELTDTTGLKEVSSVAEDDLKKNEKISEKTDDTSEASLDNMGDVDPDEILRSYAKKPSKFKAFFKNKKKRNITLGIVGVALVVLLIISSGIIGFENGSLALFPDNSNSSSNSDSDAKEYDLQSATGAQKTIAEIAKTNADSVVVITTESISQNAWYQQYVTEGAGSGIIISDDGYIATNQHVIDGASKVTVTLNSGKEYSARIVGASAKEDLAVIKINAKKLKPVTYGNSDEISVGELAVVIGNPLGTLGGSVSQGIISSTARQIQMENSTLTLIQTDAAINPGNSGGALLNDEGQLIGMVESKYSGEEIDGLGFAIPVNKVAKVCATIIKNDGNYNDTINNNTNNTYDENPSYDLNDDIDDTMDDMRRYLEELF